MATLYTPQKRDPYQLQNPQDAGQFTDTAMKADVLGQATSNPNTVIQGSQTGSTAVNGAIAPTAVNYQQVYQQNPVQNAPPVEKKQADIVSSQTANGYVNDLGKKVASKTEQLDQMAQSAQNSIFTPVNEADKSAFDYASKYGGLSFNSSVGAPTTAATNINKVREQTEPARQTMEEQQKEQLATQAASAFKNGQMGSAYADAALEKTKIKQQRDAQAFAIKERDLLRKAWDSALGGDLEISQQFQKEAASAAKDAEKANQDYAKQQKDILDLQKAETQEGGAIYSMVQSGYEPTEEQLSSLDIMRGYNPGTSAGLFAATKAVEDRKQAKEDRLAYKDSIAIQKDLAELEDIPMNREMKRLDMQAKLQAAKNASYNEMNSIFDAMKKAPNGLPIQIGDASYFGISGGAVFEKDKEGNGRLGYKDMNGNFKTQSVGFMGDPEDLEEVYIDGQPMLRNKKTKQLTPVSTTSGVCSTDTGWDTLFPVGSKGGQCGAFGHSFVSDYPYGLNTLEQKLSVKNVEPTDELKRGDLGFQDIGGDSGHVFVVQGTFKDESGREYISYIDSNRGLDERVRVGTMPKDEATIKGYFRGKVRPEMLTGTDSAGAKNEPSENENPFITPGVAMTPTQQQQAEQDFRKSKAWVAELLDGADAKDIPAEIKPIVKQMAKKQGWKDPNAKAEVEVAQTFDEFANEYQNTLGMTVAPEKIKAEYNKFLGEFEKSKTLSPNAQTAKDIFDGVSNLNINTLPAADKAEVSAQLAKYKREALKNGDLVASFRASAGGKDVSDAFLQSYEKSSSVLDRIADLQKSIGETGTGPIAGIIKSRNPYDTKAREIQTQLNALVPGLARGVYGEVGVLTDKDVELYSRTLPNLKDTPAVNKAILSATLRSVSNSIEKKLETQAAGGRDVSGYIDSYLGLKNQANQLLAEADPSNFRVVKDSLYKKQGNDWVIQK
jgi:hypothetical protein